MAQSGPPDDELGERKINVRCKVAKNLAIDSLFSVKAVRPVFDVRTPAEFEKGHIPGAFNMPLFSNEERAVVGTVYKQVGKDQALLKGLEFVGLKMADFVSQAVEAAPDQKVIVHCWRGGKRSKSMSWLLDFAGFDVLTLIGGYKNYRNFILTQFGSRNLKIVVLGGRTGCGKTALLRELENQGEQIIDLEFLARHKGSAFGWIGEEEQPSVEQFENDLYEAFRLVDPAKRVWVENESKSIGRVYIPDGFWKQMKSAPLINIELPFERRVQYLVEVYATQSKEALLSSFVKLKKRLGGQNLKRAEKALMEKDFASAAAIALQYYDKTYQYNLENNISPNIHMVHFSEHNPSSTAESLIYYCNKTNL